MIKIIEYNRNQYCSHELEKLLEALMMDEIEVSFEPYDSGFTCHFRDYKGIFTITTKGSVWEALNATLEYYLRRKKMFEEKVGNQEVNK